MMHDGNDVEESYRFIISLIVFRFPFKTTNLPDKPTDEVITHTSFPHPYKIPPPIVLLISNQANPLPLPKHHTPMTPFLLFLSHNIARTGATPNIDPGRGANIIILTLDANSRPC